MLVTGVGDGDGSDDGSVCLCDDAVGSVFLAGGDGDTGEPDGDQAGTRTTDGVRTHLGHGLATALSCHLSPLGEDVLRRLVHGRSS